MNREEQIQLAFGVALRKAREEAGLSQEALAAEAGLHRTFVSQLERGLKAPTLSTMDRVARALGTPLEELVTRAMKGVQSSVSNC